MALKIAILRGINVGGNRKILMPDLKSLCEELGWKEVKTYIQSGNIIFNSSQKNSDLENVLQKEINEKFGFEVPVIVRTSEEIQNSIEENPFLKTAETNNLHLTFLQEVPLEENVQQLQTFNSLPDRFLIVGKNVFIWCEGKYHESKLTNNFFEKKLKVVATTRNWNTVLKLVELTKVKVIHESQNGEQKTIRRNRNSC